MDTSRKFIKNLFLITFLSLVFNKMYSQNKDIWSGSFIIKSAESITIDSIRIKNTTDLQKDGVAIKFKSDLERWELTSKNDNYKDGVMARRFLFDLENEENEYEEFGWTELHLKKEMNCLDAGHLFICKTKPNSTVKIDEESFFTKTGFFGIRLHYGLFELEKYD